MVRVNYSLIKQCTNCSTISDIMCKIIAIITIGHHRDTICRWLPHAPLIPPLSALGHVTYANDWSTHQHFTLNRVANLRQEYLRMDSRNNFTVSSRELLFSITVIRQPFQCPLSTAYDLAKRHHMRLYITIHSSFVHWRTLMRSRHVINEFNAHADGVRSSIWTAPEHCIMLPC